MSMPETVELSTPPDMATRIVSDMDLLPLGGLQPALRRNAAEVRDTGGNRVNQRVDLLVTDMVMPGMLGNEVLDRVRAARPRLPALFITGYAQQVLDFHGIPAPDYDILQKPFTEAALLSRVRRALTRAAGLSDTAPG